MGTEAPIIKMVGAADGRVFVPKRKECENFVCHRGTVKTRASHAEEMLKKKKTKNDKIDLG